MLLSLSSSFHSSVFWLAVFTLKAAVLWYHHILHMKVPSMFIRFLEKTDIIALGRKI